MPKKKKLTKEQRREARLRKGAQWLTTYQGTPKHMLKHYRERFHVDTITASKDLQALGVNYTQEQLDMIRRNEEERIRRKHEEKARKQEQMFEDLYGDTCDDCFAYIAGYTSGGAPYGTTWEEMGIDPSIPFSEKEYSFINAKTIPNILYSPIMQDNFEKIPGCPVAYWVSDKIFKVFENPSVGDKTETRLGMATADNCKL